MTIAVRPAALDRVNSLVDAGSVKLLHDADSGGVISALGTVLGSPVVVYCTDSLIKGGALGSIGCERIIDAIALATARGCPVVGIWHSGGARLAEGVAGLDAVGRVFSAMVGASGVVPQISIVLGPAAGGAAYGPALTDVVIMSAQGRMFVTGPDVVGSVTGEQVDMESLGGPAVHGDRSGVAHVTVVDEKDALGAARRLVDLLARPGRIDPALVTETRDLGRHLPDNRRRAYDVHPLIEELLDEGDLFELQPRWSRSIVTGFGRLAGATVGIVANNPMRLGGCLDSASAEKAARFVRTCDSFGIPLLVVVDVPGYLPGVSQEWEGVIRRGAKLLFAFAEATVGRVTLITRKAYGGAYIAMNGRCLGADAVFAWADAECAVMGAEAAVGVMHRRTLAATPEQDRATLRAELVRAQKHETGGVRRAFELGVVDAIIDPAHTRFVIAEALARCPGRRGKHGNIPL